LVVSNDWCKSEHDNGQCIAYPTSPCMSRGRIGVISEHGFSNFYQTVIAVENIDRVAAIIL